MQYKSKIDKHITNYSKYEVEKPIGQVLIIHGMSEHRFRYEPFIKELNKNKINAYTFDLRGHGESKFEGKYGMFAYEDGYKKNIQDIDALVRILINDDLPFYLLGHSMGSLFARYYIKEYPNKVDKLILSGSPYIPDMFRLVQSSMKTMAKLMPTRSANLVAKGMNKTFNKDIKHPRTDLDWLSFNETNVDEYIANPMSNFPFTYSGYNDLFSLVEEVYLDKWQYNKTDTPVLWIVGKYDPTPNFKKDGFNKAINKLKNSGYTNYESIIYENSRHEIFVDNEKEKVFKDVIEFMLKD